MQTFVAFGKFASKGPQRVFYLIGISVTTPSLRRRLLELTLHWARRLLERGVNDGGALD